MAGRIEGLQTDLLKERNANQDLRAQLQELLAEKDSLKTKVSASALSPCNTTQHSKSHSERELKLLKRQYDDLLAAKLRAEEKHKADLRKLNTYKAYVRSGDFQQHMTAQSKAGLTEEEKRQRGDEINDIYERKVKPEEVDNSEETIRGDTRDLVAQSDKENQKTPVPEVRTRRNPHSVFPLSPIGVLPQSTPEMQSNREPLTIASSSRTLVANPRVSLHLKTLILKPHVPPPSGAILIPSSSDTEDALFPGSDPFPIEITPFVAPKRPTSSMSMSETEDDSSQELFPLLKDPPPIPVKAPPPTQESRKRPQVPFTPQPTQDRKPLIMTAIPHNVTLRAGDRSTSSQQPGSLPLVQQFPLSKPRHSDSGIKSIPANITDEQRPAKKRRVSNPGPGPSSAPLVSMDESGTSLATALYVGGDTPSPRRKDTNTSTGRKSKSTVKDSGKGKQRELIKVLTKTPVVKTPVVNARATSSKQLADYSAYKGRGRYAHDNTDGNTSINANFTIDPSRNGGKNFQYDEVVRGRTDRQRMEAGDCECCRDYYKQVGPMPPRLQAPLWRTPPSSPHESKPCLRSGSAQTESADITSHKQAISRHRYHWAPASTPPSYWSIGFPNTQEVNSINEKAREMHQQKQKLVQDEANKNSGRYKKR
ncbi:hypothetical protein K438DRAFT_1879854 [Mycena galopus ATCC 62051]|nr:hypothetical protein K438DRAFT_1879854 [Mycena galopus ATCC 62051]